MKEYLQEYEKVLLLRIKLTYKIKNTYVLDT